MFRPVSSHEPNEPVGTLSRTLSVERPNQAYSQSWIVPRAVGGEMGDPAFAHHPPQDRRRAVAQQVGAVDQDDPRAAVAGALEPSRALVEAKGDGRRAERGG